MYIPEPTFETMIRDLVAEIKQQHACWHDPHALCTDLQIDVQFGALGQGREGAAIADAIVLDPTAGVAARIRFTHYHEVVHHLIRHNGELYSAIHEQYRSDIDFNNMIERLCNVGAAEFLLPGAIVRVRTEQQGWTVLLIEELVSINGASRVAACIQLALLAPHRCIAVVCRPSIAATEGNGGWWQTSTSIREVLRVDLAVASPTMRYTAARGIFIPSDHVVAGAYEAPHGELVRGRSPIPFRSGKVWPVECEAVRLGQQVFALFHPDGVSPPHRDQLRLF